MLPSLKKVGVCLNSNTEHRKLLQSVLTCYVKRCLNGTIRTTSTFHDSHQKWLQIFQRNNISEPTESVGYIFAHLLGKKTFSQVSIELLEMEMSPEQLQRAYDLCRKRLQHMPVQYVIEEWDFHGLTLKMRPPVFIPRPETEQLVDIVTKHIREVLREREQKHPLKVLEVGCGSGCISLALLDNLHNEEVEFTAIDATQHAVELTRQNLESQSQLAGKEKINVFRHRLAEGSENCLRELGPFDVIVSNPPYVPTNDMENLAPEILRFEDETALYGGNDGLDVIRTILQHSQYLLFDTG